PTPPPSTLFPYTTLFRSPRFDRLYRRWLRRGAAGLTDIASPMMADALTSGRGRVECVVLDHAYEHLTPVIDDCERVVGATENDRSEEHTSELQSRGHLVC